MDRVTRRAYRASDLEAVVELRIAIEQREPGRFPVSRERLKDAYRETRPGWWRDVALWERDGQLAGVGEINVHLETGGDRVAYLRLRVHPDEQSPPLIGDMLTWAEKTAGDYFNGEFQIEVSADQHARDRIAAFEKHGYAVDRLFHQMRRPLDAPPAEPAPVPGYTLRALRGESEVDAWISLYTDAFQDHYDFHPIARDDRLQLMARDVYAPEFDLVTESESGALAAFCVCDRRMDDAGAVDWHIDLVGTHRDHRKRGLGEWLVQTTLEMIFEHGGREATLEVDATSPTGANRLYERLGFVVTGASIDFRKSFNRN
jgi:mycothiol synthase